MKQLIFIGAFVGVLVIGFVFMQSQRHVDKASDEQDQQTSQIELIEEQLTKTPVQPPVLNAAQGTVEPLDEEDSGEFGDLPTDWQPNPAAVSSMREARLHGDDRAPPIVRPETEFERATAEELADPDLYLEYEARQQQKVYSSFVQASEKKIADLEDYISQAEQEGGISEEQLAEGREKLEKLKAMNEQLIEENPDLELEQDQEQQQE